LTAKQNYENRVATVRGIPGLVAFWDFVQREDGPVGAGKFVAHTAQEKQFRYSLEPRNISLDFWKDGPEATLSDFPLLNQGPFGQAVQFSKPKEVNDLPVLVVPRSVLHNTPLDIKGPGKSVSMVVWMAYQGGDHAIAGIWHEGTDTKPNGIPPVVKVRGQRQFALFAGLAANPGGSTVLISENGLASFGDKYARHLATAPEKMRVVKADAAGLSSFENAWSCVGFVFDNRNGTLTSYLDGVATESWVENLTSNRFYAPTERAWKQGRLAKLGADASDRDSLFPTDQYYTPPETTPLSEQIISETADERTIVRTYEFTKVKLTFQKDSSGAFQKEVGASLIALKVNPYWFGHDIYCPASETEGGPFSIGRVIHSNRHSTLQAQIGGVAVYDQPLTPEQMRLLADISNPKSDAGATPVMLSFPDVTGVTKTP